MSERLDPDNLQLAGAGPEGGGWQNSLRIQSSPVLTVDWDPGFLGSLHRPSVLLSIERGLVLVPPTCYRELTITLLNTAIG